MGWLLLVCWRVFQFWFAWVGMSVLLGSMATDATPEGEGLLLRLALLIASAGVMMLEWLRVNGELLRAERALVAAAEAVPPRVEKIAHGCLSLTVAFIGFNAWLEVTSTVVHKAAAQALALGIVISLAWAVVLAFVWTQWATLVLSGWSHLRLLYALRALPAEGRPKLRSTAPWLVATLAAPGLFLALVGAPSPETTRLLADLTVDLVRVGAKAAIEANRAQRTADATWRSPPASGPTPAAGAGRMADGGAARLRGLGATAEVVFNEGACRSGIRRVAVDDPYADSHGELAALGATSLLAPFGRVWPPSPVRVAVVDSGIDGTHEDLRALVDDPRRYDLSGHGTAVAGAIAAIGDNARGVATLNLGGRFVRLRSVPVLDDGDAGEDELAEAIRGAVARGERVVNLSLGAHGRAPDVVTTAVATARARGVILVAAAGNDGGDSSDRWPANVPGVLVVGSLGEDGHRASYSDTPAADAWGVYAPGSACTTALGGGYLVGHGTSISAGLVSGAVAALLAVCPTATLADFKAATQAYGRPATFDSTAVYHQLVRRGRCTVGIGGSDGMGSWGGADDDYDD